MELFDDRLPDRFWDKVMPEPNSGCWLWTAGLMSKGYGLYRVDGIKRNSSHAVTYDLEFGLLEEGFNRDHKCRVRCCCNPAHLEGVTIGENVRRGLKGVLKK